MKELDITYSQAYNLVLMINASIEVDGKPIAVGLLTESIKESVKRKLTRSRKAFIEAIGEDFKPSEKPELLNEKIKVLIDPVNAGYLYDFTSKDSVISYDYDLLDLLCE
jgi:hypothetical protein